MAWWASLVAQWQRIRLPIQETWVRSLGQEDPLEEEMATHSSVLAWETPWTEEPGELQSWGRKELDTNEWLNTQTRQVPLARVGSGKDASGAVGPPEAKVAVWTDPPVI